MAVDLSGLDPRADLSSLDPRNVEALLPLARAAKGRRFRAKDFAEHMAAKWQKQARKDIELGMREPLLIKGDLAAALGALSEIILAVWGERVNFLLEGDLQS
jgi:hypothetical protein